MKRDFKNTAELCSEIEGIAHSDKTAWKTLQSKFNSKVVQEQCQSQLYLQQATKDTIPFVNPSSDNKGSKLMPRGAYYIQCTSRYQEYVVQCMRTVFHDIVVEGGSSQGGLPSGTGLFNQYCAVEKIHEFVIQ